MFPFYLCVSSKLSHFPFIWLSTAFLYLKCNSTKINHQGLQPPGIALFLASRGSWLHVVKSPCDSDFISMILIGGLKITSASTERQKRSQNLAPVLAVLVIISGIVRYLLGKLLPVLVFTGAAPSARPSSGKTSVSQIKLGEVQKGTAGRGRDFTTLYDNLRQFFDILRHLTTFYDNFRRFLLLT